MKHLVIVILAACGTTGTSTTSRDTVPNAVDATAKRIAGPEKIEKIEREHDDGEIVYEAIWHVGGLEREATIAADGRLIDLEEELDSTQVPSPVRAAALVKLANAQTIKFVKHSSGDYEAEAIIDGKEHEIVLSADGAVKATDDDEDEDDDD